MATSDRFKVAITGLSPLLMHADNVEAQDEENARGKSGGKAGDDRFPADRWKTYLYLDEQIVIPQQNILASLLKVGSAISIGGKKTLKAASQSVLFDDITIPLRIGADGHTVARESIEEIDGTFNEQRVGAERLGFAIQVAPVRVNGKRHVRTRPMFARWSLAAEFSTADDDLTLPRLKQLFALAGIKSGLGDWRPGAPMKPGPYGRYSAEVKQV